MYQKPYEGRTSRFPTIPSPVSMSGSERDHHHNGDSLDFESSRIVGQQPYNHELYGSLRRGGAVRFLSWECAGLAAATFSSVFSYTALQTVTKPLMATQLQLTKLEQTGVQRLVELPMALSFLVGLLSDCYPIYGLRRKAYMLVGLVLNAIGTVAIAIIAAHFERLDNKQKREKGLVFFLLLMTALASFGCIVTYVCVHTRTIELSQQEPLGIRGSIQASYLIVRRLSSLFTGIFTYSVLGTNTSVPNISFSTTLFIMVAICVLPLPIILRFWDEERYSLPVSIKIRSQIFWKILQQKAVWRTLAFVAFFTMFLNIRFADSTNVIRAWAGAAGDNSLVLRFISDLTQVLVLLFWRYVFMNRPWRTFFGLAPMFQVVPALVISAIVAFNVNRNRYLYRSVISLTIIADGIAVLNNIVPMTEIIQEGSEGVSVGLVLTLQRVINVFINTNAQGLFVGSNFYDLNEVKRDTPQAHESVFLSLILNYGVNALAFFGLLFLPAQKLDAQQMRMYGGFTKVAASGLVFFSTVLFVYSMTITVMTFIPSTQCLRIVGGTGCRKH